MVNSYSIACLFISLIKLNKHVEYKFMQSALSKQCLLETDIYREEENICKHIKCMSRCLTRNM